MLRIRQPYAGYRLARTIGGCPNGLQVRQLLRCLLLEHDDEADDPEAQVAQSSTSRSAK